MKLGLLIKEMNIFCKATFPTAGVLKLDDF